MLQLLIGLTVFLGIHALQSLAPQWRKRLINRWGALGFKGVYSAVSLLGLFLLVQRMYFELVLLEQKNLKVNLSYYFSSMYSHV